jgi:LEA14-like dessication related protein
MKRASVALLVLAASSSAWAWGLPKPTASIKRLQVESISLRDVTFLVELSVKNPYPVSLPVDGMSLDFSVEGAKVFSTASKSAFSVKAMDEKSSTFTVVLSYDAVMKAVRNYATKEWQRKGTFRVAGSASIKLPDEIRKEPIPLAFSESGAFSIR